MRTALLLVAAMTLFACGDSDINLSGEFPVTARDFSFSPDIGQVGSGDTTVRFTNAGSIAHEFVVLTNPIESEDEFSESLVLFEVEAAAGEIVTGTLDIAPGTYQFVCVIEGHLSAGMEGTLEVIDN